MFLIEDLHFDIKEAILDAFINKKDMTINWGIKITTIEKKIDEQFISPEAYSEIIFKSSPGEIKHWSEIAEKTISWKESCDDKGDPIGYLYTFEHEPLYESEVSFKLNSNKNIFVEWNSKCDIHWNQKYGEELSLKIQSDIKFEGIWFGKKPESQCKDLLSKFFPIEDFKYIVTSHGVSLFVPV